MCYITHEFFQHFKEIDFILSRQSSQVYSVSLAHFPFLGRPTTLAETMGKAEMWLIRSYWDLEFPHPTLPNVDYIGGLHCKPAKPLPKVNTFFLCFSFHIISDEMFYIFHYIFLPIIEICGKWN